jgi:hypothetical protein
VPSGIASALGIEVIARARDRDECLSGLGRRNGISVVPRHGSSEVHKMLLLRFEHVLAIDAINHVRVV